jgi:hypothetical protein
MAQYRLSAKIVSRSTGQSAVAAAAYRAGEKLRDERTGDIKDYTRRAWSVLHTQILTPENAPQWMLDRQRLWNQVELREDQSTKRGTAQLARNVELSLPCELTHQQRVKLVCEFVQDEFVNRGMVADIAIHAPPERGDGRNHHAHVLLTMRRIEGDGFGLKNRDWNDDDLLEHWRERWDAYQNRVLEKYGHEARVDHRSLEDQGIDRLPTTHLGPNAQAMEDRGIRTDRGDQNRKAKAGNDNLALLKRELADSQTRLIQLRRQLADERMEQIKKTFRPADAIWDKAEQRQAATPERSAEPEPSGLPPRRPPSAAERMEQIQETVREANAIWEKAEQRQAPQPEPPTEPPPPKQPEPSPPRTPLPSGPAPRSRRPSNYDLIDKQNYAERAAKAAEEEQKKRDAEREREKDERERKPDRER